jgi:hypothetical protein
LGKTKNTRGFVMKMKTRFRVIVNSNEEKNRKSSGERMKIKLKKGMLRKR